MNILTINSISKSFGGLKAVDKISLNVKKGDIHALIGPNGAGKTTIINMISGLYSVDDGDILFNNESILHLDTHHLVSKHIIRTFQNLEICQSMSVLDNVLLGFNMQMNKNLISCSFKFNSIVKDEEKFKDLAFEYLKSVGIEKYAYEICDNLSYGILKKLEIARSLATSPKLLLLDEPVAGLNSQETTQIAKIIQEISSQGISILLIEHDMKMIMDISDTISVINFGKNLANGTPKEISSNKDVIKAYLGEGNLY